MDILFIKYLLICKSNKSHWNGRWQTVSNIAWEKSQYLTTPLLVSHKMRLQNWWCITTQIITQIWVILQAPVVQTSDSAIHRINHYPADSVIDFRNTYPVDSAIQLLNNWGQVGKINLLHPIRSTIKIWVVTCHWYGISALFSHTSVCG